MYRNWAIGGVVTLAALATSGCRTPQIGEIPLGSWGGHGEFVALRKAPGGSTATPVAEARTYVTELKITKVVAPVAGRYVIEIESARGKIQGLDGDRTHIVLELEPAEILDGGRAQVYHMVRGGASLDASPPHMEAGKETGGALWFLGADGPALHISYQPGNWEDVLRFDGRRVYKDGAYTTPDATIHWSEELVRR